MKKPASVLQPAVSPALAADAWLIKLCDRFNEWLLYLTFLIVPLIFVIYTRDQFELPKLTVLRIMTSLMLAVWLIRMIAARRIAFRRTPLDLPILVWLGLQVVTSLFSVSTSVSWLGEYENFRGLLTTGNYVALYYLAVNFIRSRIQIDRVLFVMLLSGLIITAYGIAQYFGIDFIAWNPASISKGRYFSTLGNPNFLAAYLAMVMPLLVVFFVETQSAFRRLLLFICFILMFSCLMGTWSRGGFLGLVGALAVLAGFALLNAYRRAQDASKQKALTLRAYLGQQARSHKVAAFALLAAAIILVAISATFGRAHMVRMATSIIHFQDAITHSRLHIWGPAVKIFRDHPVLGTGLDTFKTVFPQYATPDFAAIDGANVASRTAHNEILQVLATQGLIGFVIVAWLTWAILRNWLKSYAAAADRWRDRLILVGLLASWFAYSIQNVFSFGVAAIDSFYWLLAAAIVLLQVSPEEQARLAPAAAPAAEPHPVFARLLVLRPLAYAGIVLLGVFFSWQALKISLADYAYNRGTMFRLEGMLDQTISEFAKAARLLPLEVKYHVYLGLAFEEKTKTIDNPAQQRTFIHQALAAYQQGVRLNPTNAYYLGNLGRAYGFAYELDKNRPDFYEKAVRYYREAIARAPVTVLFYQNLGLIYMSHGAETEFQQLAQKLSGFDRKEAAKLVFTVANQFYTLQNLPQAKKYYEQAIAMYPDYTEAYFNYGITLAQLTGVDQAIAQWRRALEIKPDFEPAKQMLERYQPGAKPPAPVQLLHP